MSREHDEERRRDAVHALEAELGGLARRFRQVVRENAQRLSPGLMPVTYRIFTTIAQREPVTASAVAEELDTDKALISRAVRDLEERGLIRRQPDPRDGRSSLLSITPDARVHLDALRATREDRLARTLAGWQTDDIHELVRLLAALAEQRPPSP